MASPRKIAVLGGNRIPFARANTDYAHASNQDMLTATLDGLASRFGLGGQQVGEVAGGAVLKNARDFNLTREAVLGSTLSSWSPAYDIQQACATGMETAAAVGNKIALGQIDVGIAAGVDTVSQAPIEVNEDLRQILLDANRAKGPAELAALLPRLRPSHLSPNIPENSEPRTGMSMGEHAAVTAAKWGVSREAQDELALASHQHLGAAWDRGFFDDLVTPYLGLERDNNLRADTSLEKLSTLPVVFGDKETGTMTPGNSTPLSDGAAAVLLASDEWAEANGHPVLAHLVDVQTAAVDYVLDDIGLLMAPVFAVPQLLERNSLTLQDFDRYEIHEAFASTVLATLMAWEDEPFCQERLGREPLGSIDRSKLNVNGSSLAAAHPFAATGGRILASTAKMLDEMGGGRALISICAAGGQGIVAIVEKS